MYGNAVYGPGSGPIWLSGVNCEGSEISIDECQHRVWGTHNCDHWKDVSINCSPNGEINCVLNSCFEINYKFYVLLAVRLVCFEIYIINLKGSMKRTLVLYEI